MWCEEWELLCLPRCLNKPEDDLFKLFKAANCVIICKALGSDFLQQSKGCNFMDAWSKCFGGILFQNEVPLCTPVGVRLRLSMHSTSKTHPQQPISHTHKKIRRLYLWAFLNSQRVGVPNREKEGRNKEGERRKRVTRKWGGIKSFVHPWTIFQKGRAVFKNTGHLGRSRYNSIAFIHQFRITCARQMCEQEPMWGPANGRAGHAGSRWKAVDECRWMFPWKLPQSLIQTMMRKHTCTQMYTSCTHTLSSLPSPRTNSYIQMEGKWNEWKSKDEFKPSMESVGQSALSSISMSPAKSNPAKHRQATAVYNPPTSAAMIFTISQQKLLSGSSLSLKS